MPSLQYHLFKPMMRIMRWQQSRFPAGDVDAFVPFRRQADRVADLTMHPPRGVKVEKTNLGGVAGEWLIPEGAPENPVMLFFHGGGILITWGSPHRRMLAYLAKFTGLRAFGLDYRLMPGNPYPAAHDDCFTAYRTLVEQGKQVVLIGESSGGVLALATLLRAREAGLPQPLLCVLISPTVDYGFEDERMRQSQDVFLSPDYVIKMHKHYVAGNDTRLPDLGPVYADLSGLAPLYIMSAEHDALRGETERLSEAAERHSVPVEVNFWPHVWHGWHLFAPQLPEATNALHLLGEVIHQRVI